MKTMLVAMTALLAGAVCWAAPDGAAAKTGVKQVTLADARARIDKAVANPAAMKLIMQRLSAEDQKAYLADVNAAIATMPASDEDRVATYVKINRAALESSKKGNVSTLLAESFATVSPVALPALAESLGSDLMNRAADKNRTYTDAEYLTVCSNVMTRVNERTAEADHSGVRSGFAALMLVYGANSSKAEITGPVVAMLPSSAQEPASKDWFPGALAEGDAKNYDAMLAAADVEGYVGLTVDCASPVTLVVRGPVLADPLIIDILGGNLDSTRKANQATPIRDALIVNGEQNLPGFDQFGDMSAEIGQVIRQREMGSWVARPGRGQTPEPSPSPEPGPYPWQSTRW